MSIVGGLGNREGSNEDPRFGDFYSNDILCFDSCDLNVTVLMT